MLDLVDMSHLNEGSNVGFRDLGFSRSIIDVATQYRRCIASVNVTFIPENRVAYAVGVEDSPMSLDHINSLGSTATRHVRRLQMLAQIGTVSGLIKLDVKLGVNCGREYWASLPNEDDTNIAVDEKIVVALAVW